MIAIGIPTLNEADNISKLVKKIEKSAIELSINIIIINSDSCSGDNTSEIFKKTKTKFQKISLNSQKTGKGYNVKNILDYIVNRKDISYCLLVDGDVKSFETEWLKKHIDANNNKADFVIPNYSRHTIEGNTTNHFVYPLLFSLTLGNAPYQGIAGDFGLSIKFIKLLESLNWPDSAYGYGVDIFLTLQAIFKKMNVVELELGKKIHKPSFNKMIRIFKEVATSYYDFRKSVDIKIPDKFFVTTVNNINLLKSKPLINLDIEDREETAIKLLNHNTRNGIQIINSSILDINIDINSWVNIILKHEDNIHNYTSEELSDSITPYYLLRVTTYLKEKNSPQKTKKIIKQTAESLLSEMEKKYV